MNKRKKILSIVLKTVIGLGSTWIIYYRLKGDFTPKNMELLTGAIFNETGLWSLVGCILLIPINWGIESYKWKLITSPVEFISFKTASKSVYSGVCVGNLAPGRATEFLAKIIFFKPENRAQITVLHFINGMFQLSVTYLLGFLALSFKAESFGNEFQWIANVAMGVAIVIIFVFVLSLIKVESILKFVTRRITKNKEEVDVNYRFTAKIVGNLFGFSVLRYAVFFLQMMLILNLFTAYNFERGVMLSVLLYFLITTTIPMISFLEAAIRAAVALVVFKDSGISNAALALSSVIIWLVNIILPSIVGYFILLKQDFDFKLTKARQ